MLCVRLCVCVCVCWCLEIFLKTELKAIKAQQELFEQRRAAELAEAQRLEAAENRRVQEKARRTQQEQARLAQEKELADKMAARKLAKSQMSTLQESVLHHLAGVGAHNDPLKQEIDSVFMPWLVESVRCLGSLFLLTPSQKSYSRVVVVVFSNNVLIQTMTSVLVSVFLPSFSMSLSLSLSLCSFFCLSVCLSVLSALVIARLYMCVCVYVWVFFFTDSTSDCKPRSRPWFN